MSHQNPSSFEDPLTENPKLYSKIGRMLYESKLIPLKQYLESIWGVKINGIQMVKILWALNLQNLVLNNRDFTDGTWLMLLKKKLESAIDWGLETGNEIRRFRGVKLHCFFTSLNETPEMLQRLRNDYEKIPENIARSKVSKTNLIVSPINRAAAKVSGMDILEGPANEGTVVKILELEPHPKLNHLEVAKLSNGKQVIVGKHYEVGFLGVFFPEGVIISDEVADEMWVKGKLAGKRKNKVKTNIRQGVISEGLFYGAQYFRLRADNTKIYLKSERWNDAWKEGEIVRIS